MTNQNAPRRTQTSQGARPATGDARRGGRTGTGTAAAGGNAGRGAGHQGRGDSVRTDPARTDSTRDITTGRSSAPRRRRRGGSGAARTPGAQHARPAGTAPTPIFAVDPAAVPHADTATSASTPAAGASFTDLGVPAPLLAPLAGLGATSAFPIQAVTLPASLQGRDVLGRGRTGSGKTIAFAIPLVARLAAEGRRRTAGRPRGLVLVPTRELALQVHRTVDPLAQAAGLRTMTVFGGVGYGNQTQALRGGVDIVIACPGRLEDLITRGDVTMADVQITVLDEADHMADLGFLPAVRRLLRATAPGGQRLLFSATLDNGISVLVNDFLTDPAVHAVDGETSPVAAMSHHVLAVSKEDRAQVVRELAAGRGRRLLFTRTKYGARKLAATLTKHGIPAVDLHGNLSQNARERNLAAFASGEASVLVATDIAARGIHVDDVTLVVHVDPPAEHKAYLHRSGRTARAGAAGQVVTLMLPEQAAEVRTLMNKAGISAPTTSVQPGHPVLAGFATN
ncbi:DEAD/DEAH box helicase [Nakamurella leprariae]|uniref:DEAD/DEAH box helicase n=1 Tax=Nakamurella leprariae TaxID=2803911 RepID=A0A938YGL1_9ACTN|nr:DEAD/DEAH box helicase [Nakamurella leprariae]MBM9467448.1 DEAD/DEAH box helicase [Nakamurella leprariae]